MPNLMRRAYWTVYIATHLVGQGRYPWYAPERIARDRDRNVRRMVAYAYRWVPYYRRTMDGLGLTPDDIRGFEDLRRLPLISVADLQRDPEAFRSTRAREDELTPLRSSGSTGSPHLIWHDLGSLYANATDAERERRMLQRIIGRGWRYSGMSIDALQGHAFHIQQASRAGALWPRWLRLRRARVEEGESLQHMVERLNLLQPDLLTGFGSTLSELFLHLAAAGEPFHRPRVVRYVSEALPEEMRRLITETYGIPVFSLYQSVEALKMGWECDAHQGYHINADHYPVRIVAAEGRDVTPGEVGEVVVCNLVNRGTVLLNYRMGDLAQRIDDPCPCGRGLPRIGWVEGRSTDVLLAPDGHRVAYSVLARAIRDHGGVWQWQIVQEAHDRLVFNVRLAPDCDRESLTVALTDAARQSLGDGMSVEVRCVDEISHTAGGKARNVINRVLAAP